MDAELTTQRRAADQRTLFEQAIFRVQAYVESKDIQPPDCFISYAWGEPEHERWVEKRLAQDLQKAGISVILDRWENSRVGSSISRFVERIEKVDRVITIGTPLYRKKYENKDSKTSYVVAGEIQLINDRLLGTEEQRQTILPLVLAGEKRNALPPLLHDKVHADFRNEETYFTTAFDLILDLYNIPHTDQAVADLREQLRGRM
ncbi:MAG: toll/interleukin-1 receptor domain-containing protein [Pseudomonadota bacterium]